MLRNILKLDGVEVLTKNKQISCKGGFLVSHICPSAGEQCDLSPAYISFMQSSCLAPVQPLVCQGVWVELHC